jgi:hypothetical protein
LRSLQEIQPDFVEKAKAKAGLWSEGKKKEEEEEEEEDLNAVPIEFSQI